jgi:hypothetical protein
MANTMILIASSTVGSGGAASIDFTSIPQTYTDLKLVYSIRGTAASNYIGTNISLNGTSTSVNWLRKQLEGGDGAANSYSLTSSSAGYFPGASMTASTFGSAELYFPNYTNSNYKSISLDSVGEGNSSTSVYQDLIAELWSNTAAITSISIGPGTFAQYSTAYLYGVKNA